MKPHNTFKSPDPYISKQEMREAIKSYIVLIGFVVFVIILFSFYPSFFREN